MREAELLLNKLILQTNRKRRKIRLKATQAYLTQELIPFIKLA